MPLPRYEKEREWYASRRFSRAILMAFAIAALVGLIIGAIWVVAGIWHFHGPR
jgi:hypothetical protein